MVIFLLIKNTMLKIKKSLGRYISLLIIAMVGAGFYAGIQATAPDVISVADSYYKNYRLMDFKIVSSMGLTDDDVSALKQIDDVNDCFGSYSLDVQSESGAIRIHAVEDKVNIVKLTDGRMPQLSTECVADGRIYNIGDKIEVTDNLDEILRNTEFSVVGLIDSVLYLDKDYGSTTGGNGKLASFVFIDRDNFVLDTFTEIYVIAETDNAVAYSKEYKNLTGILNDKLVEIKPDRENARYNEILNEASTAIAKKATESDDKEAKAESALSAIERPKWYISGRNAAVGYNELESGIQVINVVSAIIPLLFIVIAILMTTNSMARMIIEERGELGTLTSLGYKESKIVFTYLLYVLSASGIGAVTGFFIGCRFIPPLIYSNFVFILPPLVINYSMITLGVILAVTCLLMTVVTVVACNKELKQKPAILMRPLPPKHGQRIILEKIGLIWKHLSFTWKITMRNMFRYKKRALMTVVGVAGCTSLLLVAFGLRDSMDGVAEKQYGDVLRYNNMIILREETSDISGELAELLDEEQIINPLLIRQSALKFEEDGKSVDFYLVVPHNDEIFDDYYSLTSVLDKRKIKLDDNSVIVTQRLAKVNKLRKGDTIKVKDTDNNSCALIVSDIAENYTSNYIYTNYAQYDKTFGEAATFNAVVSNLGGDETELSERLMDTGLAVGVTFTSEAIEKANDSTESLNGVIILIVVVASLLAAVVLYNLTAINISERTREIATLKVLGFRDGETNAYIYREALILSIVSIGIGMGLGVGLHRFVVELIELGALSLLNRIEWFSFVMAAVITMIFTGFMQIATHLKLKKIDMIESLKSVE